MSDLFSWFSWGTFSQLSHPLFIFLLAGGLMPYTLIIILVIFFLVYLITKKLVVKDNLKFKHYIIVTLISLLIVYIVFIGLMYLMSFGLGRISQYI